MGRVFKFVALAIGLTAFTVLAILGFAIWVFIPLLPAGIIVGLAIFSTRRKRPKAEQKTQRETEYRKAA